MLKFYISKTKRQPKWRPIEQLWGRSPGHMTLVKTMDARIFILVDLDSRSECRRSKCCCGWSCTFGLRLHQLEPCIQVKHRIVRFFAIAFIVNIDSWYNHFQSPVRSRIIAVYDFLSCWFQQLHDLLAVHDECVKYLFYSCLVQDNEKY